MSERGPGAWLLEADDVVRLQQTDLRSGLTSQEATRRLVARGPNELVERHRKPPWKLFVAQFANTMILVLGIAAVVTAVIGEVADTIVIAAIVVLNGTVGFVQEYRAERTMAALRRMTAERARVVRDGAHATVAARDLVPGDLVVLAAGDVVPADLRLVAVEGLRVNEAALTGESEPTTKTVAAVADDDGSLIGDRACIAFKGTAVTYGRATGVVVATGMATELGQIAALLQAHGELPTPLQLRLASLARRMAAAAVFICGAVFGLGVARGEDVEHMFVTAISLAVAAIPEGLPAVVTVALALGAHRMADRRALVRKLPAVETLGSVTVICSDKTGTLTQNRMLVERVWTPSGRYVVTGSGYEPKGEIIGSDAPRRDRALLRAAAVAAACNDAALHPPEEIGGTWTITGDPTEGALLAFAGKLGVDQAALVRERPRRAEIAFDSGRRRMATVHDCGGRHWIAVKGAIDAVVPLLSDGQAAVLADAEEAAAEWAEEGYRVLALAEREVDGAGPSTRVDGDLRLVGVVAIADPPRPDVENAIRTCRAAGIQPVMITGDHALTASAIARRLGILTPGGAILTGADLDRLDDEGLAAVVADVRVYARTSPEQKLRIVDAWKRRGAVVAMTGDGVNDAPALRRADIGVAMGVIGTDVSKEAADMVLADDDFATVVHAVEEGRRIYDNIRRFVRYMLTTNSGEIWVMFLAPLLGLPVPLTPVQILWVNLVTDGLPAIALGLEPADGATMRRPPRAPTQSIFADGLWQHAVWVGLLMAAVVLPVQALARAMEWHWPTMVFTTLALLQLGHALAVRSEHRSFRSLGVRSNPWLLGAAAATVAAQLAVVFVPFLQPIFDTDGLGILELAVVVLASTTVFTAVEMEKVVRRGRRRTSGEPVEQGGDLVAGSRG